ncbi:unnamed protein product, partial [Nesidiocoris tenuis]
LGRFGTGTCPRRKEWPGRNPIERLWFDPGLITTELMEECSVLSAPLALWRAESYL